MAFNREEFDLICADVAQLVEKSGVAGDALKGVQYQAHAQQSPMGWVSVMVPPAERPKLLTVLPTMVRGVPVRLITPGAQPVAIREGKLDGKFHGVIHRDTTGVPVPNDEFFVLCVYDNAVPKTLEEYVFECARLGAPQAQINAASALLERVRNWRERHGARCRNPGVADQPPTTSVVSDRVRLWPRDPEQYPGTESTLPSGLPPKHQEAAAAWLEVNQKKPYEVFHGVYPLGFVQNLMERLEKAEAAAAIANNGVTAGCYTLPQVSVNEAVERGLLASSLLPAFRPLMAIGEVRTVTHNADLRAALATKGAPKIADFLAVNQLAGVAVVQQGKRFLLAFTDTTMPIPADVLAECDRVAVQLSDTVFVKVFDGDFDTWLMQE